MYPVDESRAYLLDGIVTGILEVDQVGLVDFDGAGYEIV